MIARMSRNGYVLQDAAEELHANREIVQAASRALWGIIWRLCTALEDGQVEVEQRRKQGFEHGERRHASSHFLGQKRVVFF